jgi:ABC-type sugar transport system permease subunit
MKTRPSSIRPLGAQNLALLIGAVFIVLLGVVPLWVGLQTILKADGPYGSYASPGQIFRDVLREPRNIQSTIRSLGFASAAAAIQFCTSLLIARLLFHARRTWLLPVCLIPLALPPVATAMMWKALLDYQSGGVNVLLRALGLSAIPWLSTAPVFSSLSSLHAINWAQTSVLLTDTWTWLPFLVGAELLAFGRVPKSLIESAGLEGASQGTIFWTIVCPLSWSYLAVLFFIRFLDLYRLFDAIWAFFGRLPAVEHFSSRIYAIGYFDRDYVSSLLLAAMGVIIISPISTCILTIARRLLIRAGAGVDAATE